MANLTTSFCGLTLKTPVMPAAGPPVRDYEAARRAAEGGAGAIVTKTVSSSAANVPVPCMAQTDSGFLNTELWSELPPERWLETEYPKIRELGLPVIISLGYKAEEIGPLARKAAKYADAFELSTHYLGDDPAPVTQAVKAAKESSDLPVLVKLSPQVDIPRFARAARDAGADGLVLINSFGPCLDVDLETGMPLMGSRDGYGWLSGSAILPLALRCIYQAADAVDIPVIGVGGVSKGTDAIKMFMVGATAVQVCTSAILRGPGIYGKLSRQISDWLDEHGYSSVEQVKGLSRKRIAESGDLEVGVPRIDNSKCNKCNLCVISCAYDAIRLIDEGVAISEDNCFRCGLCVTRCKYGALELAWAVRRR